MVCGFVKMRGGFNGWFVVCMGSGMENRFMVAQGKVNGRWKLQGSMKQNELEGTWNVWYP
jgi:hypothetical protein